MKPFPTHSSILATLSLLCLCAVPLSASAIGLGELVVLSEIGQPLHAEVLLITSADERPVAGCFSLKTGGNNDLPGIGRAQLRLKKKQQQWKLRIRGNTPLNEPLATFAIHLACGLALQRAYVVMPQPPSEGKKSAKMGRTTSDIALSANADIDTGDEAVAEPQPRVRKENKRLARKKPEPIAAPPSDRLILSTSSGLLDDLPAISTEETEGRMLRLETNLAQLENSLKNLDKALALNAESKALRQQLQMAETLQLAATPNITTNQKTNFQSWRQWLALLFGILLGGTLSAGLLQWLSTKKTSQPTTPLAQTGLSKSTKSQRKAKRSAK